jgi:DNA-directed RNA polymerase specialized sigma24 family protein
VEGLVPDSDAISSSATVDGRTGYDTSRADARPWLYGIANNLLRRHRRHELRELRAYARSGVDPVLDAFDGIEERIDASGLKRELVEILARVPAEERDALLLYAWAELSARTAKASAFEPATRRRRLELRRSDYRRPLQN